MPSDDQRRFVKSQEFDLKSNQGPQSPNGGQSETIGKQLGQLQLDNDGEVEYDLPESVRDLDLNREGFEEDALKLPMKEFSQVLKSDNLICRSEDHVLNLTLAYIERA